MPITRRQREVLDHLSAHAAFSRAKASMTASGSDMYVAEKLAAEGVINKRYDAERGAVYWIRGQDEPATGASVLAGFVVILTDRDLKTPGGRHENLFLAHARYDGKGTTLRRLLRGWMQRLDLHNKDLLGGAFGIELIPADSPVFSGDHFILDETPP